MINTTPEVASEDNYLSESLALGVLCALIVGVFVCIVQHRRRRNHPHPSNVESPIAAATDTQQQPASNVNFSYSSEDETYYMPPLPQQYRKSSHPVYNAHSSTSNQSKQSTTQLSAVLPALHETHFCAHSRDQNNAQVALHSVKSRPPPLTPPPPPSAASTPSMQKSLTTFNSACSLTPRRPCPTGKPKVQPSVPASEQRSEDVNEQSSTANMMAMNKMSKEDAKRMQQISQNRSTRRVIRRPLPVSAEAIVSATSIDGPPPVSPKDGMKDPYQHVVDFEKNCETSMPKSDVTQRMSDEIIEMPPIKKKK